MQLHFGAPQIQQPSFCLTTTISLFHPAFPYLELLGMAHAEQQMWLLPGTVITSLLLDAIPYKLSLLFCRGITHSSWLRGLAAATPISWHSHQRSLLYVQTWFLPSLHLYGFFPSFINLP